MFKFIGRCFMVYIILLAVSSEQPRIEHHLEIASKNMTKISYNFKEADKAVREYSKEYNEYLDSTFR